MKYLSKNEKVLVIIGPSGSGKSSVVQELVKNGIISVTPSWTTRPPRPSELIYCPEHVFVSEEEYLQADKDGKFIIKLVPFGLPYQYGLVRLPASSEIPAVMLRAEVVQEFCKLYPKSIIYQIEDTKERVSSRLKLREEQGEQTGDRVDRYDQEVLAGAKLASRIFKNHHNLNELIQEVVKAISKDFGVV